MANELIPIRLSHLLGHSGVGAIVRGANGLVVVQDTRQWTDRQGISAGKLIPYVERVRAALGIEESHGPRNAEKIAKVTLPTLIMHAENDQIIPFADGEILLEASADPEKKLLRVPVFSR